MWSLFIYKNITPNYQKIKSTQCYLDIRINMYSQKVDSSTIFEREVAQTVKAKRG